MSFAGVKPDAGNLLIKNNFDESVIAECNTYEEAKKFAKTRYPDDEDYGVFKYDEGKLYRYSNACG